jgi:hypothetical protein
MYACEHQYEVWSPIDTIEICVKCGDKQRCEPLIGSATLPDALRSQGESTK